MWDSEFTFTRNDYPVLIKEVIPFYEEKENYEKCLEIMNLYNDFTKGKKIPILE
jgi:transcription elongation factor GreA-like protein